MTRVKSETKRSRVHMLAVAAARLEEDHANPLLIKGLRDAAKAEEKKLVGGYCYSDEDKRRIERQRTAFTMIEYTRGVERLLNEMLQRAYDLMWEGDALASDAILEFVPEAEAIKMLDAWTDDQMGKAPKSKWYDA